MQVEVHSSQVPTSNQPSGWVRIKLLPGQILNDHFTTLVVLIARYVPRCSKVNPRVF